MASYFMIKIKLWSMLKPLLLIPFSLPSYSSSITSISFMLNIVISLKLYIYFLRALMLRCCMTLTVFFLWFSQLYFRASLSKLFRLCLSNSTFPSCRKCDYVIFQHVLKTKDPSSTLYLSEVFETTLNRRIWKSFKSTIILPHISIWLPKGTIDCWFLTPWCSSESSSMAMGKYQSFRQSNPQNFNFSRSVSIFFLCNISGLLTCRCITIA